MDPATIVVFGMFSTLVLASAVAWLWGAWRIFARQPLLKYEPRRPVPWGFLDVLVASLLCIGLPGFVAQAMRLKFELPAGAGLEQIPLDALIPLLLAVALASAAAAGLSALIVALRSGAATGDFGVGLRGVMRDVVTGVVAFVMLAAPVLAIQFVLTQWFPTRHPLIELVRQSGSERILWLTALSAVVVAPIAEEFLFRALLQGWLERVAVHRDQPRELILGGTLVESAGGHLERTQLPTVSGDESNPYRSPAAVALGGAVREPPRTSRLPIWPILASAAVFAAMHLGNGPDPVPLYFLALGLGYVYQRTHRLLPCVVVHFLLNSWSLATLLVLLRFGKV